MKDGDLLLTDAAAEYMNYASDLTRTIPVNGKFTDTQKSIYNIVLDSQLAGIAMAKSGIKCSDLDNACREVIKIKGYGELFMHSTGHGLGLEVHTMPRISGINHTLLEENNVITIEPGIYISSNNRQVEKKWRGIGIRIEDDILVKKNGNEILTHKLPKEIDDIESIMANH